MRSIVLAAAAFASLCVCGAPKYSCSLSVSPRPGESSVSGKRNNGLLMSSALSNTGSKTYKRSLRWLVQVRVRGDRPEKAHLKVFHLAYDNANNLKLLKDELHAIELDSNNRAEVDVVSPTTRYTKTRTRSTRSSGGFSSTRTVTRGERIAGCVVQFFVDGKLVKSWSSDPRWEKAARKEGFSVGELQRGSGRLGGK